MFLLGRDRIVILHKELVFARVIIYLIGQDANLEPRASNADLELLRLVVSCLLVVTRK